MTMASKDIGLLVLVERSAELFRPVLHLREEILRELADDVVLLAPREKKPNGL